MPHLTIRTSDGESAQYILTGRTPAIWIPAIREAIEKGSVLHLMNKDKSQAVMLNARQITTVVLVEDKES